MADQDTRPWSTGTKRRFRCTALLVFFIALLGAAGGVIYHLWHAVPAYWIENRQFLAGLTTEQRDQVATSLQNRVISVYGDWDSYTPEPAAGHGSVGSGTRLCTITVGYQEVNTWLDKELAAWLAFQNLKLPAQISNLMVTDHHGKPLIAFRFKISEYDQVISVILNLRSLPSGKAVVRIEGVRSGGLPIPASTVSEWIQTKLAKAGKGGPLEHLSVILKGEQFDPFLRPADASHNMRLIGLRSVKDGLIMTIRAEPKAQQD